MAELLRDWVAAFVLTQAVEMPIYRCGLGASWRAAFAASAITHPIVWFVFFSPAVSMQTVGYWPRFAAAEAFAWLVEGAWLAWATGRPRPLVWSAIANGASVAVGLVLRAWIDWP